MFPPPNLATLHLSREEERGGVEAGDGDTSEVGEKLDLRYLAGQGRAARSDEQCQTN